MRYFLAEIEEKSHPTVVHFLAEIEKKSQSSLNAKTTISTIYKNIAVDIFTKKILDNVRLTVISYHYIFQPMM
jgi:hypothetical protein